MKKEHTTLIVIIAVLAIIFIGGCREYNKDCSFTGTVNSAWANVENQYQRRLI